MYVLRCVMESLDYWRYEESLFSALIRIISSESKKRRLESRKGWFHHIKVKLVKHPLKHKFHTKYLRVAYFRLYFSILIR